VKGGYRPNAGRPRKAKLLNADDGAQLERMPTTEVLAAVKASGQSPLEYALGVMRDPSVDNERRDRMCIALLPYLHTRAADRKPSKKQDALDAAARAARGRFAPSAPPKIYQMGGYKNGDD